VLRLPRRRLLWPALSAADQRPACGARLPAGIPRAATAAKPSRTIRGALRAILLSAAFASGFPRRDRFHKAAGTQAVLLVLIPTLERFALARGARSAARLEGNFPAAGTQTTGEPFVSQGAKGGQARSAGFQARRRLILVAKYAAHKTAAPC
jgi:hypothetical protein